MTKNKEYYEAQRIKWLENHGFDPKTETTYIVTGETYSIKDELKAYGMKYDPILGWHSPIFIEAYDGRMAAINIHDVAESTAYGTYNYKDSAKDFLQSFHKEEEAVISTNWISIPGDHIKDLTVTLIKKAVINGKFGETHLYQFLTENSELINWWTTTIPPFQTGDKLTIVSALVKKHDEYRGNKQTVITRPKLKKIEE